MKAEDWGIETINDWAEVLTDLDITPTEFQLAKRKAGLQKWMISHPVDFLELGRPDPMLSYPEVSQAYNDQANFKTDCPIAHETAKRVGFSTMREQPKSVSYPLWVKHYKNVCNEHIAGKEFTKPQVQQIEHKTAPQAASEDVASEMIANIRALLEGNKNDNK